MKTSDIKADGTVYTFKKDKWADAKPALLLEQHLWRSDWTWANWDGAETRTRKTTYRRSPQGARAGSPGYSSQKDGLPVLVVNVGEYRFSARAEERQILTSPSEIFERALLKSNVREIVDGAHDGRTTDRIKVTVGIMVDLVGGETEEIFISLELVRPQCIVNTWGAFTKEAEAMALRKAELDRIRGERQAENDEAANDIAVRLTRLLDVPKAGYEYRGDRADCRRKNITSSGISTTYEISQETLLKLIALAEQSGQSL